MSVPRPVNGTQRAIPCVLMRGGTSRGPFFHAADLPIDRAEREHLLLRVMGSPDSGQIDGLGGATSVTSKAAIVSVSDHPDADVDYLFAQVDIERHLVDWKPTCGNMAAGVGPFAIEEGLVAPADGTTRVVIRCVNTGSFIDAVVQTPNRVVRYGGECQIPGVPGAAAPVELRFRHISGSRTNQLMPTGRPRNRIDGIDVTCIDVAIPIVVARADALGLAGYEEPRALNDSPELMARIEKLRCLAGSLMGLDDVARSVIPKFVIVAPPKETGHLASRYLTPWECHRSYAVTGSLATASCALLPGSVAEEVVQRDDRLPETVEIEHPSGSIEAVLGVDLTDGHLVVHSGGTVRTARRIMGGDVYVPTRS